MKTKIFIICLTILILQDSKAQLCSPLTVTTDWRLANSSNNWNWTTQSFNDIYLKNSTSNPQTILSPFYPNITGQNINLSHFYDNFTLGGIIGQDFHPEDGWELLIKDFGLPNGQEITNPFFCLYNKYRSTIRVFYYKTETPSNIAPYGATIELNIIRSQGDNLSNALLSQSKPLANTLTTYEQERIMNAPNNYQNEDGFWLYADFNVAYDPCACLYNTKLQFKIRLLEQNEVTLNLDFTGTLYNIVNGATANNVNTDDGFQQLVSDVNAAFSVGNKSFKYWESLTKDVDKTTKAIDDGIANAGFISNLSILKDLAAPIPYVGAAVSALDFLISGGNDNLSKPARAPIAFVPHQKLDLTGNASGKIELSAPFGSREFWTPGIPNTNGTKAVYNNLLGVVNLFNNPKVKYADYRIEDLNVTTPDGETIFLNNLPNIREYKLKEDIKFAFNPSSDLEVEGVDAAYLLKYTFGSNVDLQSFTNRSINGINRPVEFGRPPIIAPTMEERYANIGMEIEEWPNDFQNTNKAYITLRTKYLPLQCFKDQSFKLYLSGGSPQIYVKLVFKLRRKDHQGQRVLYVLTYPIDLIWSEIDNNIYKVGVEFSPIGDNLPPDLLVYPKSLQASNNPIGGSAFMEFNMSNSPKDIALSNSVITNDLYATNSITIGDNVLISNPNVNITAGKEINILTENNISPEANFSVGLPASCNKNINDFIYVGDEISTFCARRGPYFNYSKLGKMNTDEKDDVIIIEKPTIQFKIYPNPANDIATVLFQLNGAIGENINIYNLAGTLVKSVNITGNNQETINTQDLAAGVYLVTLNASNGYSETKKLIIAK